MKDKIINFIKNPFYWNIAAIILDIVLTGVYFYSGELLLAVLWGLCGLCQIYFAWRHTNEN